MGTPPHFHEDRLVPLIVSDVGLRSPQNHIDDEFPESRVVVR